MSHKISVEGNFGSREALIEELNYKGVKFEEKSEGGNVFLTFPDPKYNRYGNPLRINLNNPSESTMDADIANVVGSWYKGAMTRHIRYLCAMQGIMIESEVELQGDRVLRVAVG